MINQHLHLFVFALLILHSCESQDQASKLTHHFDKLHPASPQGFKADIVPKNKIIHKGIIGPNMEAFYYTLSDKSFQNFNVYVIKHNGAAWSRPKKAFFNSEYDDHGMSFSPDGSTVYFSSTRPVLIEGVAPTWHIWKSEKVDDSWSEPVYVDIPNLRDKLTSHPSVTNSGTLYFHSSNLDYSEMNVYFSGQAEMGFQDAQSISISHELKQGMCTPFISPDEDYLIFAAVGDPLELMVTYNDGKGGWENTKPFNDQINDQGQGNPYVTPDHTYLFFTTGGDPEKPWNVKWVNVEETLDNSSE